MARVLVVEDDPLVRAAVIRDLAGSYQVRSAGTALDALKEVQEHRPDLVMLDLGLPDLDGVQTLQLIRVMSDVPVLVATARDDEALIARTLRDGADDYITKPFSADHLQARVMALLRRSGLREPDAEQLAVGDLSVDLRRRTVTFAGADVDLTRREFDLLAYLAQNAGRVVGREELMTEVWREPYLDRQTVDVHLSVLRRKLGERGSDQRYLRTVRGVGVVLEDPTDPAAR